MGDDPNTHSSKLSILGLALRLVASITAALALIISALLWFVATQQVSEAVEAQATTVSALVQLTVGEELAVVEGQAALRSPATIDRSVASLLEPILGDGVELRIIGFDGLALYSTTAAEIDEIVGMEGVSPSAARGGTSGRRQTGAQDRQPVVYSVPVVVDGSTAAVARVTVPDDRTVGAAVDAASRLIFVFGGAVAALVIALVPLCWWSLGDIRRKFRKTRVMALNDNLTGLANRTHFHRRLDEAIAAAQRADECVGLIVLDLDGFKAINDRGGHGAGDRLLRRVAAALGEVTRRNELACRLGGDEFAVVAPRMKGRDELVALADRLHSLLDLSVQFSDGTHLRVTASLGLAMYPEDGESPDDLLALADVGMYGVKASRRAKLPIA